MVSRIGLHRWEEPVLVNDRGAGTIFFSGCNLRCVYCQNKAISRGGVGRAYGESELTQEILRLQEEGAACIDLVTPTHYADRLAPLLSRVRPNLRIPVVYNCGGYEDKDTLRSLEGLIDIYLPDCKYFDTVLSKKLSFAPDYYAVFREALREMIRQTGKPVYHETGALKSGVIVRHLVLPGYRKDSIRILEALAEEFGTGSFLLSLMNQYTPDFADDSSDPNLHRHLTSFEYDSVLDVAQKLGFSGFSQGRSSATSDYTPDFSGGTLFPEPKQSETP